MSEDEKPPMKVYAAFASSPMGQEIIGVFTTFERAAEYAAEYNGTTIDDADVQDFPVWQFPPKRTTYWIASASRLPGQSDPVATVRSQDLWTHQPIELPANLAASTIKSHRTMVLVCAWEEEGLKEKALKWLGEVTDSI